MDSTAGRNCCITFLHFFEVFLNLFESFDPGKRVLNLINFSSLIPGLTCSLSDEGRTSLSLEDCSAMGDSLSVRRSRVAVREGGVYKVAAGADVRIGSGRRVTLAIMDDVGYCCFCCCLFLVVFVLLLMLLLFLLVLLVLLLMLLLLSSCPCPSCCCSGCCCCFCLFLRWQVTNKDVALTI